MPVTHVRRKGARLRCGWRRCVILCAGRRSLRCGLWAFGSLYKMFGMCFVIVFSVSSPLLAPRGEACFAALYALAFCNVYLSGSDRWMDENAVQTVGLATLVPSRSLAAILLRGLDVQGFEEFSRWVGVALAWFSARVRCPGELSSSRPQGGRGMFRGLVCLGLLQCVFGAERSLDG